MTEATTRKPPAPGADRTRPGRSRWRDLRRTVRTIACPTVAGVAFLVVDGVRALAATFDCRLLQRGDGSWSGWMAYLEPLRDSAVALGAASCLQGQGIRLVLAALWAFTLAMFVLSLAALVLRAWPKGLKKWVDRIATMIVDAFASSLGESGRARAQVAATALTWVLTIAAPAFAVAHVHAVDPRLPPDPPVEQTGFAGPPAAPSAHERMVDQRLARIERLMLQMPAPAAQPINVHVAGPSPAVAHDGSVGPAVRAARAAFEEALRIHQAPVLDAARTAIARTESLADRLHAVEADDRRLAAIRDGLSDLSHADRVRLAQESKPLLARWRDNLFGRGADCAAAPSTAALPRSAGVDEAATAATVSAAAAASAAADRAGQQQHPQP